jgi:hypothetical protein
MARGALHRRLGRTTDMKRTVVGFHSLSATREFGFFAVSFCEQRTAHRDQLLSFLA